MYETWFGFTEKPFNLTPDPKYLFLSPRHAEAFAHLEFGRRERGGFAVITGEVGTGKTTLARHFLSKLGPHTRSAVVLYPALTAAELLRGILDDLHVTPPGETLKSLVDALHGFLLESRQAGRDVVLLIDEAQDLSPEVLEQVRLLSNLETDTEKLIQIVLLGQSELRALLRRHELRQLAQRITARYHLAALGPADTAAYVRHRLAVAGGEAKVAFTAPALRLVHTRSRGVPRLINLICDRALLAGYVQGTRTITPALVRQAAAEVLADGPESTLRWHHGVALTLLAATLAAGVLILSPGSARAPARPAGPERAPSGSVAIPVRDASHERFESFLRDAPRDASYAGAEARLRAIWSPAALARVPLRAHLEQIRRFDLPAVLEMFHPQRSDTCFVALLGLDGDTALVAGDGPPLRVAASRMEAFWTRETVLYWPEPPDLPADRGAQEARARQALAARGEASPDLGTSLRRFQTEAQLVSDGLLGPRTRMALFALGEGDRPRLSTAGRHP